MRRWIVKMVAPALAVTLCCGIVAFAQPLDGVGKADNVEKRAAKKKGKGKRAARPQGGPVMQQIKLLETALGAPLTEKQKADVGAAHKTYQESVAKAVGLTTDELQVKLKAARQKTRAAKQEGKKEEGKPAKARKGAQADAPAAVAAQ